jgi:hypothetical protein
MRGEPVSTASSEPKADVPRQGPIAPGAAFHVLQRAKAADLKLSTLAAVAGVDLRKLYSGAKLSAREINRLEYVVCAYERILAQLEQDDAAVQENVF